MSIKITKSSILIVEGKDEVNFFSAFFSIKEKAEIQVIDFEGKNNFPSKIKTLPLIPGFDLVTKIGFIRDADNNNPISAFDSIRNALTKAKLPVPSTLSSFTSSNPSIGIFIMPDNKNHGMLEDLCLKSLDDQPVKICIDAFIGCANPGLNDEPKAKVLCYLSTRKPLVNSLGLGALNSHWNFNSLIFSNLKSFINNFHD